MRKDTWRLCLLASTVFGGVVIGALASPALAQEPAEAAAAADEEIVVTGSRIRRTDTSTSAPVTIVDAQSLTDRGFVQAGQALNNVTSVAPSIPLSGGVAQAPGNGQQFPNLFNLGAGRTLTLVNGRRMVTSSSGLGDRVVDTNIIPTGLLDRIDVVQAGGAAIYGSDAIAGVVNYILQDDFEGLQIDAQYGVTAQDDYPQTALRVTAGRNFAGGRGNIAGEIGWSKSDALMFTDRERSNLSRVTMANPLNAGPSDGIPAVREVLDARFWEFNANGVLFAPPDPTGGSCGGFPLRCFITVNDLRFNQFNPAGGIAAQFAPDGQSLIAYGTGTFPSSGPSIPFTSGGDGFRVADLAALYSGVDRFNTNIVGHYDITPDVRFSTELLFAQIDSVDPLAGQPPSNTILNPAASGAGAITIRANNPFLTTAARNTIINYLNSNPALFGPNSGTGWSFGAPLPVSLSKIWVDLLPSNAAETTTETYRALFSLDGDFSLGERDLYWSASFSRASTDGETRAWRPWTARFNNAINAVTNGSGQAVCAINNDANPANDDPLCAPLNPFGVGNVSQAARNYVSVQTGERYINNQDNLLLTLGGDLIRLPGGDAQFSVAYEYRSEEAKFNPSAANQAGLVGAGTPTLATRGEYDTNEFSVELLVPIIGGDFTLPFAQMVELTGAYRRVDNSIAGEEDVWGIGGRWEVIDGLQFRASQSRNFRAPTLTQLFQPSSTTLGAIQRDPCDMDRINSGPNPAVRLANCTALWAANPGYNALATFQDPAENFNTALITTGGNANLRNEVSETTTWGFVYQPSFIRGFTIVADRVEVDLTDGLSAFLPVNFLETCFDSSPQPADVCNRFTRNAAGEIITADSTYFNAGTVRYEGEVYNINYRFDIVDLTGLDIGSLELGLESTHTSLLETSVTGFDVSRTDDTTATPDWVTRYDVRYLNGPLRVSYELFHLPQSKINRFDTIESTPTPTIDANFRHSISAQYDFGAVTLRGGVTNFTDEEPSFPTLNYGDILGRRYYVGINASF